MVADAARVKDLDNVDGENEVDSEKIERRELKTKKDIENYIKGLI